jgi:hypothetical protein
LALISLTHVTPSSAAVFKLWFYVILLRSKTIKLRLKNCPVREAHDAATTCYMMMHFVQSLVKPKKSFSCKAPTQVSEAA